MQQCPPQVKTNPVKYNANFPETLTDDTNAMNNH